MLDLVLPPAAEAQNYLRAKTAFGGNSGPRETRRVVFLMGYSRVCRQRRRGFPLRWHRRGRTHEIYEALL